MKNAFRNLFRFAWVVLGLLTFLSTTETYAQTEKSKNITRSFSGKNRVQVQHRYGALKVKPSPNDEVQVEATFSLSGDSQADVEKALSYFNLDISESGGDLDIQTNLETRNWQTTNNRSKITFKDGTVIKNLRDIKVEFTLYIPKLSHLALANKYEDIVLESTFDGELFIELYSGKLETKDLRGTFRLDLKYGEAHVGNTHDVNLMVYDGELEIGNTRELQLNSKYSEIEIGSTDNCRLQTYEDDVQVGLVKGELMLMDKYSEIEIGNFRSGRMDLYETELEMQSGESLKAKSKYSDISIDEVETLFFESSYEDDVHIQRLKDFKADMKYSNISIENLSKRFLAEAYEGEIEIELVGSELDGIQIDGKYFKVELNMSEDLNYQLAGTIKYGDIRFPKSQMTVQQYINDGSEVTVKAQTKGATAQSPLISINGQDSDVEID